MTGPAEPWETQPPYKPDQMLEDQITDAIAWEWRKRSACGPDASSYLDVSRAYARVALRTIDRHQRLHDPVEVGPHDEHHCGVCGRPLAWDNEERPTHA